MSRFFPGALLSVVASAVLVGVMGWEKVGSRSLARCRASGRDCRCP